MRQLINRSIRHKTLVIILLTTTVALLVSAVPLLVYEARAYRDFLVRDLTTQADILARISAPSLAFNDPAAAEESLALLTNRSGIIAGAIYRVDGRLFATFQRPGENVAFPEAARTLGSKIVDQDMTLFHPVVENNELLGSVYLKAEYELASRIQDYLMILFGAFVISLLVAVAMSLWLQGTVTGPLLSINEVAQRIVRDRDFMLRAPKTTSDEIGMVADSFNAMLEEVSERQMALESSYERLQEESEERRNAEGALRLANKRKDEFLATLAHELRNPLAPMLNALDIMRMPDLPDAVRQQAFDIISRQLAHMSRLVEDLLDVSRISRGKLVVYKESVSLQTVISNAVDTARPLIDSKEQALTVALAEVPVRVRADPVRLSQVLSNLLNNAAKYTDPGGRIWLTAKADQESVRIIVSDNGKGISARTLPHVFMMFTQDEDSNSLHAGLGVGLALAKRLVELHGGMIHAESDGVGQGSTFTVQLPLDTDANEQEDAPTSAPADAGTRLRILLVDDNVDFATSLEMLLSSLKHEVRIAHDGPQALAVLEHFEPDFALLVIGLPAMDGFVLAHRIKNVSPEVRMVAISGWGQVENRQKALESGFSSYLVKPVDLATIRTILSSPCRAT
jgi:signal transduction histidine kinase